MFKRNYQVYSISFIITVALVVALIWYSEDYRTEILGALIFLVVEGLFLKIFTTKEYLHKEGFKIPIRLNKKSKIRMSFAYLIRIKVDDEFLLVKGKYKKFQPVGGVYHYYDKILESLFDFDRDEYHADEEDIRGFIKLEQLDEFISWFNSRKNRECTPGREFAEELTETGILPREDFSKPEFEYKKSFFEGIQYSEFMKNYELKRFDIYELKLNEKQKGVIRLLPKESDEFKLITKDGIDKLGITKDNPVCIIADNAHYLYD
jgi:hypothetical protein